MSCGCNKNKSPVRVERPQATEIPKHSVRPQVYEHAKPEEKATYKYRIQR